MAITTQPSVVKQDPIIDEMTKAGLHFGHKTSKTHPKMKPYISGMRNTVHLLDLDKTKQKLQEALTFIKELKEAGKTLLLVGTKVQIKNLVKETALACSIPYVNERWIGGAFTNFGTIQKRLEYLHELEHKQQTPEEWNKYTKKEQLRMTEEMKMLELHFGGIKNLAKLPDAVFVCDADENQLVVKEAKKKGISVIAIVDSNVDPTPIDYMIPANDDAVSSQAYILHKLKEAYGVN